MIRCKGAVIFSRELRSVASFFEELGRGEEEIAQEPEAVIKRVQGQQCFLRFEAGITDGAADDGVVFLFDETVVVFAIGARPREGDVLLNAVADKVVVEELGAVVGVEAEQGDRESFPCALKALEYMFLGFVEYANHLGPS